MANANTIGSIVAGIGQPNVAPLALAASTTETLFSFNTGVVATTLGGGVAVLKAAAEGNVPSFYVGGNAFRIRGVGLATTGTTANLTLTLYNGTAAQLAVAGGVPATGFTLGSLKASSARAVNTTTAPFYVDGFFQFEPTTGRLVGQVGFEINGIVDASTASTIITGMVNDADLNFLLSATLSAGNAANVVNLSEFSIERV